MEPEQLKMQNYVVLDAKVITSLKQKSVTSLHDTKSVPLTSSTPHSLFI
jgi:hypothetical protein